MNFKATKTKQKIKEEFRLLMIHDSNSVNSLIVS